MSQQDLLRWDGQGGVAQTSNGVRCTLARKPDLGFAFDGVFFNAGAGTVRLGTDEIHDMTAAEIAKVTAWLGTLRQSNDQVLVHACDDEGRPLGLVPKDQAPHTVDVCPTGEGWHWDFEARRWLKPAVIEESRRTAVATIDAEAEAARLRYITGGAGQAMTYLLKAEQARAYLANGGAVPTMVAAEAAATGVTAVEAATEIARLASLWEQLAPAIEGRRRAAKVAVEAADTFTELQAALGAGVRSLAEI